MTAPLLEITGLSLHTPKGRPLFRELGLSLGREHVAVIGRNGAGKSTLLEVLAGETAAPVGSRIARTRPLLVRQQIDDEDPRAAVRSLQRHALDDPSAARELDRQRRRAGLPPLDELGDSPLSRGEARKLLLLDALRRQPELLLLDEPTEDLDETGIDWLSDWLRRWSGGLIVVSHHRALLRDFEHFFVVAESGCRYVPGRFDALLQQLEREDAARQQQYVHNLNHLAERERHHERVTRRRKRKKAVGRLRELRRCTSRARLNDKRGDAQQSQARAARIREDRIGAVRTWAKATRRALAVKLPLTLVGPTLAAPDGLDLVTLREVGVTIDGRELLSGLDLRLGRERMAVMGPNGSGKTTLLRTMLGELRPTTGSARCRSDRIGSIAQGATDWESEDDLLTLLHELRPDATLDELATRLVALRFPLALAQRPLRSLSPGERVRAALICLFERAPAIELLVLDEPTFSLDFVGVAALERALRAWPGGLVVASHDRGFLDSIGVDRVLRLP
ncbi:MAG: ATP-binding cassette domain-containing protein [Nannocystaceae bacterium]